MRKFETTVQELKDQVLESVAELAWEDKLATGILDIPEKIIPGPEARMRCCIYKERAVVNDRVKMAMGGDKAYPAMVEVMKVACDECPVTQIEVGPACRGCIATRCVHACPKGAISIVNHRPVPLRRHHGQILHRGRGPDAQGRQAVGLPGLRRGGPVGGGSVRTRQAGTAGHRPEDAGLPRRG